MASCLERLRFFLDEQGVQYEVQTHREAYTAQDVAAAVHTKGRYFAKVFIARADGKLVMLVLPASEQVDFDRVRALLGANVVRRASEDEFQRVFPDCEVGAMPPFGHLYHLPVYLDHSLAGMPYLVFQPGSHRETMKIAMADYLRLASPLLGDFILEKEAAAT